MNYIMDNPKLKISINENTRDKILSSKNGLTKLTEIINSLFEIIKTFNMKPFLAKQNLFTMNIAVIINPSNELKFEIILDSLYFENRSIELLCEWNISKKEYRIKEKAYSGYERYVTALIKY